MSPTAPSDRRHHDDRTTSVLLHPRETGFGAQHRSRQIGFEHFIPIIQRHGFRCTRRTDSDVVVQDIQAGPYVFTVPEAVCSVTSGLATSPANTAASPPSSLICLESFSARSALRLTSTTLGAFTGKQDCGRHPVANPFAARRGARHYRHLAVEPSSHVLSFKGQNLVPQDVKQLPIRS